MRNSLANAALDTGSGIRLEPNIAQRTARRVSTPRKERPDAAVCLADYVEQRFIPNHVFGKTDAGRTHYRAILKHVLTPEAVERMFASHNGGVGSSRVDLQACKLEYSIVSPK